MDSFYVVLPSNSGDVEGNTTSRFTVRMPDTLELDSSWTVALSNIIYPFSFSLLGDSDEQESITIYRRYGKELLSIRIEIPDLSFASEEALEEALNAVLLDAWKKELDREREEMRLEENKKRIYGNFRKRRDVVTISDQLDKNGKEGIRLPPIKPHEVDGIAMIRFTPNQDQKERIKQALDEFNSVGQTEEVPSVDETHESASQTLPEGEQKESLTTAMNDSEDERVIQQLEEEGHFDMSKDLAYKFIQYLNKEIKGAKLPVVSSIAGSSAVRLKPQPDQKDIIINAIKSFVPSAQSKPENNLQVENESEEDKSEGEDLEKTKSNDDPPIPKSPETPNVTPVEKSDDTQTEKQTPLDGKVKDTPPTLTDEEKTLMGMAVRAATRSMNSSLELAKQAQLNKELNNKYWLNARYKYALKDEEVILIETAGSKRKIPATILKWVITQLNLLIDRANDIDKWIQECLESKEKASEAQLETKAAELRGDVTEARKSADRAKAAEQKVKELSNQVEEAVAGQKLLSEEIIGKVEAEHSKIDDETSKITTPNNEETSTPEEGDIEEHESEEPQEHSDNTQEKEAEPSTHQESEDKYKRDEETSAPAEDENVYEEHERDIEDPHGTSEEEMDEKLSSPAEERVEEKAETIDEVAEGPSEDTQEQDEEPSADQDENIEKEADAIDEELSPSEETQKKDEVAEEPSEDTQENDEDPSTIVEDENIEPHEEHEQEVAEVTSEEILENVQESTTHENEKNIEPREEIEQEVTEEHVESSKEKIQEFPGVTDEDEEPWTPRLEEPAPHSMDTLEDNESHELPTINEEDAVEPWSPEKKGLEKPQESPAIINKELAWTPPEKVSRLPTIEEEPEQEEIQPEDLSSLPELPRPEMLIADPPERPSFWKSFFGDRGRHVEDKTKEKELPQQENIHPQKESEEFDDSEPKKLHLAEYAYPPEYLKMLLNFSNIQLADPEYQWVSILYDKLHKRFHVFLQGNVQFIKLSRQLAYTLGFDSEKVHSGQVAKYMPDISGGVRQFLVYAPKLVENSIIGNVTAPLLRVVNVSGGPGESISEVYMTEHHHRLLGKRHPDITIEIRTLTGKLVKFHWGTCILTLHFQRSLF
uniref:Uncharacterized protein n=1 Tax=Meloidogyne incognita TaxID=6306 RepID=A0A914M8U4_MELIC